MKRSGERAANVSTDTEQQAGETLANNTKPAIFYSMCYALLIFNQNES